MEYLGPLFVTGMTGVTGVTGVTGMSGTVSSRREGVTAANDDGESVGCGSASDVSWEEGEGEREREGEGRDRGGEGR